MHRSSRCEHPHIANYWNIRVSSWLGLPSSWWLVSLTLSLLCVFELDDFYYVSSHIPSLVM